MAKFFGKSVYKGMAIGPVVVLKNQDQQVKRKKTEDPEGEIQRVADAIGEAQTQLQGLYDKAVAEVGEASAAI